MDELRQSHWNWLAGISLLSGAALHATMVLPELALGEGGSIIWLPLNIAPFAALFAQWRILACRPRVNPALLSAVVTATTLATTVAGAVCYRQVVQSHSLLSPIGFILTPIALAALAPIASYILYSLLQWRKL